MTVPRRPVYLDYAATTPIDLRVRRKMGPYLSDVFGNPGSRDHRYGWDAAEAVEEARYRIADLISATTNEIVFTSCATESINLALKGPALRESKDTPTIVTTAVEHEAVLETCRQLERQGHVSTEYLPVDPSGNIDTEQMRGRVCSNVTLLVSLMLANNEIGTIYPIREAAKLAHDAGALFFTDATQAAGKIPIDVRAEAIDLMAFSSHKLYGPKGIGALYVRGGEETIELAPLINGGGQERGQRSGTLNVPGIVGFGEACRIAGEEMADEAARITRLRDQLERRILTSLPGVSINGEGSDRLPGMTNLCCHGLDARTLIRDMHDVAVSTRSACSSSTSGPSHVLKALGLSDDDAYGSIRFSLGRFTTEQDIDFVADKVISAVQKLRQRG